MASILLLPDEAALALVSIEVNEEAKLITATAQTTGSVASSPVCGQGAHRIHSTYVRTLADLPCSGQQVCWLLQVRRFWCENTECERIIFTERLPTCAPAHVRRTLQLAEVLCEVAFALGGKAGSRVAKLLGMGTSHQTLLRLIRKSEAACVSTPRVLGLDDFAWKKGNRWGTILVDLEKHAVIDVLPDREKKTVETWLKSHPGIEIVSRDRASSYAEAISAGAPQAVQVADRFHLLVNLREHLKSFLDHKRTSLPQVEIESSIQTSPSDPATGTAGPAALASLMKPLETEQEQGAESESQLPSFVRDTKREKWFHAPDEPALAQSQVSRSARLARYEQVRTLHEQGLSLRTIAHTLGIARETVSKFLHADTFPEQATRPREKREGKLDPFIPYLLKRWQEREYNGTQLYREIRDLGYNGSRPSVALFIADLRRMHPPAVGAPRAWIRKDRHRANGYPTREASLPVPPPKRKRLSPAQVAWLFVCQREKLTERQQKQLAIVCQAGSEFQEVYTLAQDFVRMITQQQADSFEEWVKRAEQSGIPSLKGFALSLRRDAQAVLAALRLPWSQGQTEGQVHRLKLIKRQAYGRASFDQLRLRVLHRSGAIHQEKFLLEHSSQQK